MKTIVLTIIALASTMCNEHDKDEKVITGFLEQIVLNESYDVENIDEYVDISEKITYQKREGLYKLLAIEIAELRKKLKSSESAYEIITHDTTKYSNQIKDYNLNCDDYDKVYYLVKDEEINAFFIMVNKKIRAFFPGITKKRGVKNPLMLNME